MTTLPQTGRRFFTVEEITGPLLFVKSISAAGYGELVDVLTSDGEERTGQIIDVSRGGLAFIYSDVLKRPEKKFNLYIFLKKYSFRLEYLSVKTISDFPVSKKFPFIFNKKRRFGVQFVGLISNQKNQLEYFIEHYIVGEA